MRLLTTPSSIQIVPRLLLAAGLATCLACAPSGDGADRAAGTSDQALSYPDANRSEHVDNYFGQEIADPYRWFEDLDSPETGTWVKAQNDLSRPYLEGIASREHIKSMLERLWDHERITTPRKEAGAYFYSRNDGLQDQSVYYRTTDLDQPGEVVLDPNTFSDDGTVSLAGLQISPTGKHIAYARSDGGSDWRTWHVRDLETGKDTSDVLQYTKFSSVSWTRDGQSLYYSRYPTNEAGEGDDQKTVSIYHHKLGTDQSEDQLVYKAPSDKRNAYASVTEDGRYALVSLQETSNLNNAYSYVDLQAGGFDVKPLLDDWNARYGFVGNVGSTFYFTTNLDAPRQRVFAIDVAAGDREPREILAESEHTLRGASLVGGHLLAYYLADAHSRVMIHDQNGELVREVELPGLGSVSGFGGKWDDPETFYSFESFSQADRIYRYDIAEDTTTLYRETELPFSGDDFESRQVFYESKDGTKVPMFITHRKGLELDGSHPTLLYGYGGFNIPQTPRFSVARAVWLEMGGVLAVANLRGGGEYGREWHLAGTKLRKQNVFDDFIAAAEYLIAEKYTTTPKLAIQGGSNGGLLVGAVMTQRPELFGAALPAVGVLDMLRYHTASANARNWSNDYGLSENEDEFKAQLAYSPVHNADVGTCYPPTLVTTADHDDRVVPWHSFKFGAALQHAQGCGNPILVRIQTRAGHGAGTPTWMRVENIADQWAFLAKALGMSVPNPS